MSAEPKVAERFGRNLVRARERAGMTQQEVGSRASLDRSQLGVMERGERLPRIDTLIRLAGALEVSVDELLAGIVWRPGRRLPGSWGESDGGPAPDPESLDSQ